METVTSHFFQLEKKKKKTVIVIHKAIRSLQPYFSLYQTIFIGWILLGEGEDSWWGFFSA